MKSVNFMKQDYNYKNNITSKSDLENYLRFYRTSKNQTKRSIESKQNNDKSSSLINAAETAISPPKLRVDRNYQLNDIFLSFIPKRNRLESTKHLGSGLPPLAEPGSNMNNMSNDIINNIHTPRTIESVFLDPVTNAEEMIYLNAMNPSLSQSYRQVRVMFTVSVILSIVIVVLEALAIIYGAVWMNRCERIDVFIMVSGIAHIIIIMLEWMRVWIWGGSNAPSVTYNNSDHMTILLTIILILLYIFCLIWYAVGFVWIPVVFVSFLKMERFQDTNITLKKGNKKYSLIIPACSVGFYTFACCYQAIIGMLFILRVSGCCMSDFCKSLWTKYVGGSISIKKEKFDQNVQSPLEVYLPPLESPIFKYEQNKFRYNDSALNTLFSTDSLCMISPMPLYGKSLEYFDQKEAGIDIINNPLSYNVEWK